MKKFTFRFYIGDYPTDITVVAEKRGLARKQVESLIDNRLLDAMEFVSEEEYTGE